MLVLSRRLNEKLLFPAMNTVIQVVALRSGVVRLGVEAPADVTVLREEVQDRTAEGSVIPAPPGARLVEADRDPVYDQVRERLKDTGIGLGLLRLQLEAGLTEDAKETLDRLREDFQVLRYGVEGEVEAPQAPGTQRATLTALLVEDDQNERELLAGFLRMAGIEVQTANDGLDALDYLHARGRPDLMLLDMGLPRCDGPTTVQEIRRDPAYAGLKIFAVTGHAPEKFGFDSGPAGVDRWFRKPINPETLIRDLTQELACLPCGTSTC